MRRWTFYASLVFLLFGVASLYGLVRSEYPTFDKPLSELGVYMLLGMVAWFVLAIASWIDYRKSLASETSE